MKNENEFIQLKVLVLDVAVAALDTPIVVVVGVIVCC